MSKETTEDYISPWKQILSFLLKDYGGKVLLHCNFSAADLPSCLPNFYRECFEVWCNLSVKPILSREQVLNQLLWNNQFLRVGGKPIFNKKLFSKGLISLANILTNTGRLKSWTLFKAEGLNVNDYLLLFGLFNSLPLIWKKLINSKDETSANSRNINLSYTLYLKDDTPPFDSLTSSKLYWKLLEIIQVYPSARHKFSTLFQNSGDLNWEVIYQIPRVATLATKTRIFQYKLLNRIIYTNKSLYKMKMIDSPLCTFCKISDESLEHLFCRCDFIVAFWMSVVLWLKSLHIAIDSLNDSDIILGLTQKRSHWLLLNHIIIAAKLVIYHSRLKNILPSLRYLMIKLNHIESSERSIAIKNNRLKIHEGKWKPFIN